MINTKHYMKVTKMWIVCLQDKNDELHDVMCIVKWEARRGQKDQSVYEARDV